MKTILDAIVPVAAIVSLMLAPSLIVGCPPTSAAPPSEKCEWSRAIEQEDLRVCVQRNHYLTQEQCLRELGYWNTCSPGSP